MRPRKCGIRQGCAVNEGQVREIEQIVSDELIVGLVVNVATRGGPGGIIVPVHIDGQLRVGLGRNARPDPQHAMLLDERKRAHAQLWRDLFLAWHLNADTVRIEFQPVVSAPYATVFDVAQRQRSCRATQRSSVVRNSTTCSPRIVRASGCLVHSWDIAAAYQAFRTNIVVSLPPKRQRGASAACPLQRLDPYLDCVAPASAPLSFNALGVRTA